MKKKLAKLLRRWARVLESHPMPGDPSEEFLMAFADGGGIVSVCDHCGITHVCDDYANDGCFEDGELASYRANAAKHPGRYIFHDYSSTTTGSVDGVRFVADCPCNGWLARYEQFILNHRSEICRYLKAITKHEVYMAKRSKEEVEGLNEQT